MSVSMWLEMLDLTFEVSEDFVYDEE